MIKLSILLIEGRLEDFKTRYKTLPDDVKNRIIQNDPSPNKKYIDWMGKVVYSTPDIKLDDLLKNVVEFDKYQASLGDIYKFKTYDDLKRALSTRQKSNKEVKREGSNILLDDENFLIVAPTTQESCAYYGNNTRWCIVNQESWWNKYYYKNTIIILSDRRHGEKYAIVGNANNGDYTVYDRNDHTLSYGNMFGDDEDSWPEYVQEIIEDYMSSDNPDSRQEEYHSMLVKNYIEDEGTDSIWQLYVDRLIENNELDDSVSSLTDFKVIAKENGLDENRLKELATSFLWNQLIDGIDEDDLGRFRSNEELRMSLDNMGNDPHVKDTLEQIDADYTHTQRHIDDVLEILQQSIPPQEYYRLYNNGKIDKEIIDAISKYNKMLNSKTQLSFGSKSGSESVQIRNISDIIYVLKKTGYENVGGYLETLAGLKESIKTLPLTIIV